MASAKQEAHWNDTKGLMRITLAIWFFFSIVIFMFGHDLNSVKVPLLGYPLSYYMTAQGSLAAFVILIFWFAGKQEAIDRKHGFSDAERTED
jgi:putative solute:sodium symporter small subunit|tara:strand:+ start:1109 stop:1384 length:276 start_codon:yes stop_codon:yes gene_type:complete